MVQTKWRSPTMICTVSGCKARFVLHDQRVKTALYTTMEIGDQQAEITVHRAKVQLKSRAATSDMSTKRIVAQTVSGLDFESRAKLACQLNCLGKMARSSKTAANRHPPNPTSLENLVLQLSPTSSLLIVTIYTSGTLGFTNSLRRSYIFGTCANLDVLRFCLILCE